jgi:DNA-binding beta-propeller fold protein YncE
MTVGFLAACGAGDGGGAERSAGAPPSATLDSTDVLARVGGLSGPEAVRWDPDQDVWFVANFGPSEGEDDRDGDGFLSRVGPDGDIVELRFMVGSELAPLHMPRGMTITGDTLWVADVDGVHGFDRASGDHLAFVDFTALEPGFINDLAVDAQGTVYATDTGRGRIYRIVDGRASVAVEDDRTGPPNGITREGGSGRFLLAPWGGGTTLRAWDPADGTFTDVAELVGGNFDGIEVVDGRVIIASQADSTLHAVDLATGTGTPLIRVPGRPADIAVDPRRGRIAVPYIALNRVDIWQIPSPETSQR